MTGVASSAIILSLLLFIIVTFYILTSVISVDTFFYVFLIMSFLTDGLVIILHVIRSPKGVVGRRLRFNPHKLTVLIISYNGADVIAETIRQAKKHVPTSQIIVVSDASTDTTAEVARSLGVRVFVNPRNVNKALSINAAVRRITTPYTLILDDDTLIGDTFIPTSLLDEGYTAVAFNVMPIATDTFVNAFQRFEYRKSMVLSKNLRSSVGAIGNVSGAIGLFHTSDLVWQSTRHSGQFGGEDEQRTILAHLEGKGKGVTFTSSTVKTHAPDTLKALAKQRSFSWNLSVPELLILNTKLLLDPRHHFLLKAEKAYGIYLYLTDPLRLLFFWVLLTRPIHIVTTYGFYLFLTLLVWFKTGRKDKLYVVLLFPLYSILLTVFRFVSNFYWFKVKFLYFRKRFHRHVPNRRLAWEFMVIAILNVVLWATAAQHLGSDLNLLSKLHNNRLDSFDTSSLDYDEQPKIGTNVASAAEQPQPMIVISVTQTDKPTSLARKIVAKYMAMNPNVILSAEEQEKIEQAMIPKLQTTTVVMNEYAKSYPAKMVEDAIGRQMRL